MRFFFNKIKHGHMGNLPLLIKVSIHSACKSLITTVCFSARPPRLRCGVTSARPWHRTNYSLASYVYSLFSHNYLQSSPLK